MGNSQTIVGLVRPLKLLEVHLREVSVFSRLVPRKTRSALVRGEARERALRRLAAIHEEDLVAFERPDASFEHRDLRFEFLDHLLAWIVAVFEKDATEGR